jgi:hypothetical protein
LWIVSPIGAPRDDLPVGDWDGGLGAGGVGGTRCPLPANVEAGLDGGAGGTRAPYFCILLSGGFILRLPQEPDRMVAGFVTPPAMAPVLD